MSKTLLPIGLLLFIVQSAFAQKPRIEGYIVDDTDQPIELANAILTSQIDSSLIAYSITNPKGRFLIENIDTGRYVLTLSYIGYADVVKSIHLRSASLVDSQDSADISAPTVDLGKVQLTEAQSMLDQVEISARRVPIRIKTDTIEYNADAFKTEANASVEDLLKKLPGVEVDKDGSIKAQGEDVQKVMVDGKEFFGSDPTIATKNLPADAVKKVQVLDKKSENAEFTGVDDGQRTKTINLELKEDKKNGMFGSATAGYGQRDETGQVQNALVGKDLYYGKVNLNRFSPNSQLSLIGLINNVNEQGFGWSEYREFMGGMGSFMRGGGGSFTISGGSADLLSFEPGTGFSETVAGGINYNLDISDKSELRTSYILTKMDNTVQTFADREVVQGTRGFDQEGRNTSLSENTNHRINSAYELDIDSSQNLTLEVGVSWNQGDSRTQSSQINQLPKSTTLISNSLTTNTAEQNGLNLSAGLDYRRKFKKTGRYASLFIDWSDATRDGLGVLDSRNQFFRDGMITQDSLILQDQIRDTKNGTYALGLSYNEPLSKALFLELRAARRNRNNNQLTEFYDINPDIANSRTLNELLSNTFDQNYLYHEVGSELKYNGRKSVITLGANLQQSQLSGTIASGAEVPTQNFLFLLPAASWRYDIAQSRGINLGYSTSVQEPSLNQLSPIIDNSDPLNVYVGNPDLSPEYTHRVTARYRAYSQFSGVGFFVYSTLRYTVNNISNEIDFDEFAVRTTTPVNLGNALSASGSISFNAPVKPIKHDIRLRTSISYQNNPVFLNRVLNDTRRFNNRLRASLRNWNQDVVSYSFGANVSYNNTSYSVSKENNRDFWQFSYFADLALELPADITLKTNIDIDRFSAESFGESQTISLWNASISKLFGEKKKISIALEANDLLNQNLALVRTANLNFIEETRTVNLARYFMLKMSYSFKGFGEETKRGGIRIIR